MEIGKKLKDARMKSGLPRKQLQKDQCVQTDHFKLGK